MGNFNRGNKSGRSQMHHAVCDECGRNCEVPFKPSGDKPIYCSDCFEGKGGDNKRSGGRDFGGQRRDNKRSGRRDFGGDRRDRNQSMHKAVCDECGRDCEVPFKPTSGKPIFCDNCFGDKGKGSKGGQGASSQPSTEQYDKLNKKLDQILGMLSTPKPKEKVEVEKKPKKAKKVAVKKPAVKKVAKKKPAKKKVKAKKKKK